MILQGESEQGCEAGEVDDRMDRIRQQGIKLGQIGDLARQERSGLTKVFADLRKHVFAQPASDSNMTRCASSPVLAEVNWEMSDRALPIHL